MLLRNGRVIDSTGDLHERLDLRVRDGRFVEMGLDLAPGAEEVEDLDGLTVIPGLFDAHTHLSLTPEPGGMQQAATQSHAYQAVLTAQRAKAMLGFGITSARDVGGVGPEVIFGVRDAIRAGKAPGPRIFSAGRWFTATGGHGWPIGIEVDDAAALRKAVRNEIKLGADLIKFMVSGGVIGPGLGPLASQFSEDEIRMGVQEAAAAGLGVAAHAHGETSIAAAVRGGVTTLEHGTFMTEALAAEMVERGAYLTPTLAIITRILAHADDAGLERHTVERAREVAEIQRRNVAMAFRTGIPLLAGTDMGSPFAGPDTLHDELRELVALGMTPMQALQAASLRPAEALKKADELGSIALNRRSDLVVLEEDPLADIRATRSVRRVLQDGFWVA